MWKYTRLKFILIFLKRNMIVQIRIEPETLEKIRKLIDEGHYKNIHDFVNMAIENQIQLDFSEDPTRSHLYDTIEIPSNLPIPEKFEFEIAVLTLSLDS